MSHSSPSAAHAKAGRTARLLEALIAAHLEAAVEQLRAGGTRGVHLARKAMRRARALLQLAKQPLTGDRDRVDTQVRALCASLSALRDIQAGIDALARMQHACHGGALDARRGGVVRSALVRRLEGAMQKARSEDPEFASARARLDDIRADIGRLGWQRVTKKTLCRGLRKSLRGCRRAVAKACRSPAMRVHHRVRRRLRALKYQLVALGSFARAARDRGDRRTQRAIERFREARGMNRSFERGLNSAVALLGQERDAFVLRQILRGRSTGGDGQVRLLIAMAAYRRDLRERVRRVLAKVERMAGT